LLSRNQKAKNVSRLQLKVEAARLLITKQKILKIGTALERTNKKFPSKKLDRIKSTFKLADI